MPHQASRQRQEDAPAFVRRSRNGEAMGVRLEAQGPVAYLQADSLKRPLEMPSSDFRRVIPVIIVAILIAAAAIFAYNATVVADRQETAMEVAEVLNRNVTLDLPQMEDYVGKSNDAILSAFKNAGYTIYDNSTEEDKNVDGFDVYKLPSDVTVEEAEGAYSQGIENLSAVEAARFLSGSWRYLVSRSGDTEMRLRYMDFAATTPTAAINDALASQGFDAEKASDPTEDTLGNTNVTGTFKKGGTEYEYTISVCELSQVYDIEGLPDAAQYVGIRITG